MIQVEQLTKRYGSTPVLDSISFNVPSGRTLALWGGNGAGKSTTLKCLLGLSRFEGRVRVGGHDVRTRPREARSLIGYVPQEMPVYDLSVGAAVEFFASLRGASLHGGRAILAEVGLSEAMHKPVRALSGGMRQRLAVALALLGDPPVLLLDEPTANLDERVRKDLLGLLARLRQEGRSLVIASHRFDEVGVLADAVLELEAGETGARARLATGGRRPVPGEEARRWLSGS